MLKITLIGSDASGKDTQAALLKNHFENQNKKVQIISIWDSLADFSEFKDKNTLQEMIETFLLKYDGHARSYFLLSCLKNAEAKIKATSDVIIFNGFYHKYWASEMAYGIESDFWQKNTTSFSASDKCFFLKVPVEVCLLRKSQWSAYESGKAMHGLKNISKEDFQKMVHTKLDTVANKVSNLIIIDGTLPEEEVTRAVLKYL